jgi:Protein of unknown function (DUF2914)
MTFISGLSFLLATASYPGEVSVAKVPEVELALGYTVKNRELEALDGDNVFLDGDRVVAWSAVTGMRDGFIEHVWYKDGEEIARHYLPVGAGRRWRTWTRHEVEEGEYVVKVLGPDGALLKEIAFMVDVACGE